MGEENVTPDPPSAAQLIHADDETAESLVVEYADACIQRDPTDPFGVFSLLPAVMQYVYSTALLEGEVESGGFNQYFFNVSSDYALEALDGYRRFGASQHARLLREAIRIYHEERWFHFRVRAQRSLEVFLDSYRDSRLHLIDEQFLELEEDILALRAGYIRANLDQFTS